LTEGGARRRRGGVRELLPMVIKMAQEYTAGRPPAAWGERANRAHTSFMPVGSAADLRLTG
jgi:hypothetical protein